MEQMKLPREERPAVSPRTLDPLQADLLLFQTAGNGDLKQAKKFNNVIGQYFFKIPLTQVTTATYNAHSTLVSIYAIGLSARASHNAGYILPVVDPSRDSLPWVGSRTGHSHISKTH